MIYNFFGSKSSIDIDVMVLVDEIPKTIMECHYLVEYNNERLKEELAELGISGKRINSNICTIDSGIVTKVFKGTKDEVNNSLIDTYVNFKQIHPLFVKERLKRDVDLKVLRTFRIILSFLSRGEHRSDVKDALGSTLIKKINVLNKISFSKPLELGNRNVKIDDFYKTLAFQLGQTILLTKGIEAYTKERIDLEFEDNLSNALYRCQMADFDYTYLEFLKKLLIKIVLNNYTYLLNIDENTYLKSYR